MTRSKAYRSTEVKHVDLEVVIAQAISGPVWVGVDVGKKHAFVVVRFSDGSFNRPWKVRLWLAAHRPLIIRSTGTSPARGEV